MCVCGCVCVWVGGREQCVDDDGMCWWVCGCVNKGYGKFSLRLIGSAMFGASFNLMIFGKVKDDSLSIHAIALNHCLCHRNVFENGVNTISKIIYHFLLKSSKFCIFHTIRFCSNFNSMWSKYLLNNVWRDFWLPMSGSVMIARNTWS